MAKFNNKFKLKIASFVLKKKLKKSVRTRQTINLNNAKTIGIIYNDNEQKSNEIIEKFVEFLSEKNIQVYVVEFINKKIKTDNYIKKNGFNYFSLNDLNCFYKPKSVVVDEFINNDFDILIDLSLNDKCFPVKYINALSKAKFKVGKFYETPNYFDFMINIDGNNNLKFFIEQIKNYLTMINNK
ncbi:MAG: hypothetical protein KAG95_02910 [Bacteroidales bacterium]|nr:hypothetical protein [Bacteroidales bacterium]